VFTWPCMRLRMRHRSVRCISKEAAFRGAESVKLPYSIVSNRLARPWQYRRWQSSLRFVRTARILDSMRHRQLSSAPPDKVRGSQASRSSAAHSHDLEGMRSLAKEARDNLQQGQSRQRGRESRDSSGCVEREESSFRTSRIRDGALRAGARP
jgi:hypothetical protein